MKMESTTSWYYDNVVIQRITTDKPGDKHFRVHRHLHPPKYYYTEKEAYQASIQLLFDAMVEE